MAPSRMLDGGLESESDKCSLPFLDPSGHIVFFDVQPAEPGSFAVPAVIELEVYEPGSLAEFSWIYFKGDPQAGPQPGHPFDMPFNDSTKFSVGLVKEDDTSTVIRQVMSPTNSSLFWEGGAPFGRPGNYSMYIPRLDRSCKYYYIGEMIYRWPVPKDIEGDSIFRLKLTTDEPPNTHLSGKLQISNADATPSPLLRPVSKSQFYELSNDHMINVVGGGFLFMVLTSWAILRLCRRSKHIALK